MRLTIGMALLAGNIAASLPAQTRVPGDPFADEPAGVVIDPCPLRPTPTDKAGWTMWNLHMLTRDFGQLCRYRADDRAWAATGRSVRVVFMGDSITDNWQNLDKDMFTGGLVDRGISGQTTPQMLVRFREDVVALHPLAVHIMAGTNDIAGNTGAVTLETVEDNIRSMAEIARASGIKVILASVPPAKTFPWAPDKRPVPQIAALNAWVRGYAAEQSFTWVDYGPVLADGSGAMRPGLSSDGVHPTAAGYAAMKPLALAAVKQALGR